MPEGRDTELHAFRGICSLKMCMPEGRDTELNAFRGICSLRMCMPDGQGHFSADVEWEWKWKWEGRELTFRGVCFLRSAARVRW